MEKKIEVYYDGVCKMCTGAMNAVENSSQGAKFERRDVTQGSLPPGQNLDAALYNMHVVDETGRVYVGADGILRIIEEYPRWRWIAAVGKLPGVKHLIYGVYRVVAAHRRRFNSILK